MLNSNERNPISEYHKAIIDGTVTAGTWVRKLYSLLISGMESGKYTYSEKRAYRAIDFIENFCHHWQGQKGTLKLELWQKAAVAAMFGLLDGEGNRQFREVVMIIGRKNGKSLLASGISIYMGFFDGEIGAQIYTVAPKLAQARIIYESIYESIQREPELQRESIKRRSDIYIKPSSSSISALPFTHKKSDGLNAHLCNCDEIAAWQGFAGLRQYEVMKSSTGTRKQPMMLNITTAGYENDGIYDELYKRGTAFLNGIGREERILPIIYQIDDVEKWNDIYELKKANPNLGVSIKKDFFLEEAAIAEHSSSKKTEFLTKYCNVKQNASVAWLDYNTIDGAMVTGLTLDHFRGCYCVGGIDLSQTTDLTAACVLIECEGIIYNITKFFMPRERIIPAANEDRIPYQVYMERGDLMASGDNKVDYRDVLEWFVRLYRQYGIIPQMIGYDRYCAQYLIDDLKNEGFRVDDVHQGENLTPIIKEFEGLIKDGKYKMIDNNLLKINMMNVAMKINAETRKVRPVKISQRMRIDGFVAAIDALAVKHKWHNDIGVWLENKNKKLAR